MVVQRAAGAVESVGSVRLVGEAVVEDVENGGIAVLIKIGVHSILLAFDVLLNEEFLSPDDEFRELRAHFVEVRLDVADGGIPLVRIAHHMHACAQEPDGGFQHQREGEFIRVDVVQFYNLFLAEEEVRIHVLADAAEGGLVFQ